MTGGTHTAGQAAQHNEAEWKDNSSLWEHFTPCVLSGSWLAELVAVSSVDLCSPVVQRLLLAHETNLLVLKPILVRLGPIKGAAAV